MKTRLIRGLRTLSAACALTFCATASAQFSDISWNPVYTSDIHAGYSTTTKVHGMKAYCQRVYIGTNQGFNLTKFAELGFGLDAVMFTHYYKGQGMRFSANPYFYLQPTWPFNDKFSVFLNCTLGATIPVINQKGVDTAFLCHFGPGIRYRNLSVKCGLNSENTGNAVNTFFVELGLYLK